MKFFSYLKRKANSTFYKLTVAFIVFGMMPLLLIGLFFIVRYYNSTRQDTENNYLLLGYYLSKNVEDLFDSVDDALSYVYDYSNDDYSYLYEILKDDSLSDEEKGIYINGMLHSMLVQSEDISSIFFVTPDDYKVYGVFYEQGKVLKEDISINPSDIFSSTDYYKELMFSSTVREDTYCVSSSDYVFSLVRNYMDTSNVKSINNRILGTLYANIDVDEVEKVTSGINLGMSGKVYIVNKSDNTYLYCSDSDYYTNGEDPLNGYYKKLTDETGNDIIDGSWLFYSQIGDTDNYVVISISEEEVLSSYFKNRGIMLLILAFTIFVVLVLYFIFSEKMSEPARKLKKAMQDVWKGDFTARVEIKTADEMEYLGEGFNKMVMDLQYYIEQVYVAQIDQKEAELQALKMQIQPHYLYNTLDVIRMTALESDDFLTAGLIESLSKQLRYVISNESEIIPLYEELNNIKEYFVISKVRYNNRFGVNITVSDKDKDLLVMKLILQPAVENAIKHGLVNKDGKGAVLINIERKEDYLEIKVMDNGVGISDEKVETIQSILDGEADEGVPDFVGIGLKNVYKRIKKRCGDEYGFSFESYENMGTIIIYKLPIWEGEADVESSIDRR